MSADPLAGGAEAVAQAWPPPATNHGATQSPIAARARRQLAPVGSSAGAEQHAPPARACAWPGPAITALLVAIAACNVVTHSHPWLDADEGIYLVIGRDLGAVGTSARERAGAVERGQRAGVPGLPRPRRLGPQRLPYRDVWDNHMPGIYAVTWLVTRAGSGPGMTAALRLMAAAVWLASVALAARAWRLPSGRARLVLAALPVAVLLHPALNGDSLYTEYGEACAGLLALSALVLAERTSRAWAAGGWSALAGLLTAAAIAFRPTAALYLAPLLWLAAGCGQSTGRRALSAAGLVAGAGAGVGALAAGLASAGALDDCVQLVFGANARISETRDLAHDLRGLGVLVASSICMGSVIVLARRGTPWLRERYPRAAPAAWALVAVAVVEALLPRKGWPHYLLPAFCFLLPLAWGALAEGGQGPRRRNGVLVGFLVVSLLYSLGWAGVTLARWVRPRPLEVYGVPLSRLTALLRPGDTVWSGGTRGADLYWDTGCPSATRYLYASSGAAQSGIAAETLLADLRAHRPRLVLIGPEWLDPASDLGPAVPAGLPAYLASAYIRETAGMPGRGAAPRPGGLGGVGPSKRPAALFVLRGTPAPGR